MRRFSVLLLLLAAGCATSMTVDHNVGLVKNEFLDDAMEVLEKEGITAERGQTVGNSTGIRVSHQDAYWATKILLQWRRTKDPGAYITREEFEMQLEYP
jgi:hypothetical protein